MKVALYSRKSKFTENGDSIENQIEMCKNYIYSHLGKNIEFIIYTDEGFSGKNTERPNFKQMLLDAEQKKFDTLICYRLDRLSRNIADFSELINRLQYLGIAFISIKEQFDTSTPIGRAMMYIASIFAQLERETTAERVSDNMLELAKSGRWLGGQTPLGFKSKSISYFDSELKERKMFKLSPINNELKIVKLIYKKYLEFHSINMVAKYLSENSIKTKMGNTKWSKRSISSILNNTVYVRANKDVLLFLQSKGIITMGKFDGKHGILTYNKKKGTNKFRNIKEWVAAVAKHEGVINANLWLEVQKLLYTNKVKAPRIGKTNNALLTGILRCKNCGSFMKIIHGPLNKDGKKLFYYKCSLKESSKNSLCKNSNIRCDEIEKIVIKKLSEISIDKSIILTEFNKAKMNFKGNERNFHSQNITNICNFINALNNISILDSFYISEKKLILSNIIDTIFWDGTTGNITIRLIGQQNKLMT